MTIDEFNALCDELNEEIHKVETHCQEWGVRVSLLINRATDLEIGFGKVDGKLRLYCSEVSTARIPLMQADRATKIRLARHLPELELELERKVAYLQTLAEKALKLLRGK